MVIRDDRMRVRLEAKLLEGIWQVCHSWVVSRLFLPLQWGDPVLMYSACRHMLKCIPLLWSITLLLRRARVDRLELLSDIKHILSDIWPTYCSNTYIYIYVRAISGSFAINVAWVFLYKVSVESLHPYSKMSEVQQASAAVRLNIIQQHLSASLILVSTKPASTQRQKYSPQPHPYEPFRPVKVS
jgi:hypothetical protein